MDAPSNIRRKTPHHAEDFVFTGAILSAFSPLPLLLRWCVVNPPKLVKGHHPDT